MLRPEIADAEDMHVCMAGGDCDAIGTSEIFQNEDGSLVCICHPFFGGIDCSQCIEGYYRNKDGFCEKASLCVDEGGEEDCNGHGVCYQEGPSAVCICDHGFTHDGLDQCARCQDPMMQYPHECHKSRNWVTSQEEYECESLMHEIPRELFRSPKDSPHGGLSDHHQ